MESTSNVSKKDVADIFNSAKRDADINSAEKLERMKKRASVMQLKVAKLVSKVTIIKKDNSNNDDINVFKLPSSIVEEDELHEAPIVNVDLSPILEETPEVNVDLDTKEDKEESTVVPVEDLAKSNLASFIHKQMDDIEVAIEVLKLAITIRNESDPDTFIALDFINVFDNLYALVGFLNNFELDTNVKDALTMKIDESHDELVDGCNEIIGLIEALTILLNCIKKKFHEKEITPLDLANEIDKIMKTNAGRIVLSLYDLEL